MTETEAYEMLGLSPPLEYAVKAHVYWANDKGGSKKHHTPEQWEELKYRQLGSTTRMAVNAALRVMAGHTVVIAAVSQVVANHIAHIVQDFAKKLSGEHYALGGLTSDARIKYMSDVGLYHDNEWAERTKDEVNAEVYHP